MSSITHQASSMPLQTTFDRWWQCPGQWVEPANQRRGGESGVHLLVQRDPMRPLLYCKRQVGHLYRSLQHPLGRPTIVRELKAYRAYAALGIRTPKLVYGAVRRVQGQWQALLVTEALSGFVDLNEWYARPRPASQTRVMLQALAATLARLHLGGWQHGCCYPKHIFVKPGAEASMPVEIAFLDLEKSRRRWWTSTAARRDLYQLARHRGNMPETDHALLLQAYQAILKTHRPDRQS